MTKHQLYTDADKDAPATIKDNNGQVVLGLCKLCGKGEIELSEPCWPKNLISVSITASFKKSSRPRNWPWICSMFAGLVATITCVIVLSLSPRPEMGLCIALLFMVAVSQALRTGR